MTTPPLSRQVIKAAAAILVRETASGKKKKPADQTALHEKIARLIRCSAELKQLGL